MARDTTEVLIGVGTLYTAPVGTPFPDDPDDAVGAAWSDIGYSEEGWSLNVERDVEDIEVAEEIDPIDVMPTSREAHIVGEAVQTSLENVAIALGGGEVEFDAGPPATYTYTPTGTDTLDRIALLFRTKAPAGNVRDIRVPHAISVGAVELASRKAPDKSKLAMDFRLIKVTGDEFFEIVDTTDETS